MAPPSIWGGDQDPSQIKVWVSRNQGTPGPAGAGESHTQHGFKTGASACALGICYSFSAGLSEDQRAQLTLNLSPFFIKEVWCFLLLSEVLVVKFIAWPMGC